MFRRGSKNAGAHATPPAVRQQQEQQQAAPPAAPVLQRGRGQAGRTSSSDIKTRSLSPSLFRESAVNGQGHRAVKQERAQTIAAAASSPTPVEKATIGDYSQDYEVPLSSSSGSPSNNGADPAACAAAVADAELGAAGPDAAAAKHQRHHHHRHHSVAARAAAAVRHYFAKWRGDPSKKRVNVRLILFPHWTEMAVALVGSFVAMGALGAAHFALLPDGADDDHATSVGMIIGSFGASAVLMYGAPLSPLTQPRNLVGGHVISALCGVSVRKLVCDTICPAVSGSDSGLGCPWLGCALAVSTAIGCMLMTDTVHPPGGATALIAIVSGGFVTELGYLYVLVPVLSGALVMLLVSLLINNLDPYRSYPVYWY